MWKNGVFSQKAIKKLDGFQLYYRFQVVSWTLSFHLYCPVPNFIIQFPTLLSEYRNLPPPAALFDGDGFGEISGFVDVAAAGHRDMIGK